MRLNEKLTYKELCLELKENELQGGRQRTTQLKKLSQSYEIEKIDKKYIIKREYTKEEKIMLDNNGKFTIYIKELLLNRIKNQNNKTQISMSYREIFEGLAMVNENYYKAKYNEFNIYLDQILDEYKIMKTYNTFDDTGTDIIEHNMRLYFYKSGKLLREIIGNSLKSMQKNDLIIYSRTFLLIKKVDGIVHKKYTSPEEDSKILGIIDIVKSEFNDTPIFYLSYCDRTKYYDRINEEVKRIFNYDFCFDAVRIILSVSAIQRDLLKAKEIILNKQKLNKNVQNKFTNSKEMNDLVPQNQIQIFNNKFIDF